MLRIKRAYDKPSATDGVRILVDRLWPRGLTKEEVRVSRWMKELSPSDELRRWFQHDPEKWPEFRRRFLQELKPRTKELDEIAAMAKKGTLTLVFAAKDPERCNATVLKEAVEKRLDRKARTAL